MLSTPHTGKGFVANHWAALVVVAGAGFFACADAAGGGGPTQTASDPAAQAAPAVYMTPAQVLGVQRALATAANREAAVAYGSADTRIADLTNRIANTRIAQVDEIDRIAAALGITVAETPVSLQIATQSERDVAALRAAAKLDDTYINGVVLTEARAIGLTDYLLAPNAATGSNAEIVAAFINRARVEWVAQMDEATKIQRARNDWHFNTTIRDPDPNSGRPPPPR